MCENKGTYKVSWSFSYKDNWTMTMSGKVQPSGWFYFRFIEWASCRITCVCVYSGRNQNRTLVFKSPIRSSPWSIVKLILQYLLGLTCALAVPANLNSLLLKFLASLVVQSYNPKFLIRDSEWYQKRRTNVRTQYLSL